MIDKIITAYLKNNKRLVVPEFGAFIHKEGEEVVFVEFLKKDDQVLSSLLCREYSIDEADAHSVIEEYVANIRRSVGTTGKYVIDGLGSIRTDVNGLYALAYDPRVRKEAAEVAIPAPEEPIPAPSGQPAMRVVTREQPEEKTAVHSSGGDKAASHAKSRETNEYQAKSPNVIEFGFPEQTHAAPQPKPQQKPQPKPEEKKPFTLNDLYSIPADDSREEKPLRPAPSQPARHAAPQDERRTQPQRPAMQDRRPQAAPPRQQMDTAWEEDERPRRRPAGYDRRGKSKADWIMIVAIAAAAIALIAMAYGIFVKNGPEVKPTHPQIENTIEATGSDTDETTPDTE